jgi:hypothetical protein
MSSLRESSSGGAKTLLRPLHQACALSDAEHPWPNSLRFAELIEFLKNSYQCFLRHLLCVVPLPAHHPAVPEDLCLEMLDETVKCFGVAGNQPPCELNFNFPFQSWFSPMIVAGPYRSGRGDFDDRRTATNTDSLPSSYVAAPTAVLSKTSICGCANNVL